MPCGVFVDAEVAGVLRLRGRFASRSGRCAQDDNQWWRSGRHVVGGDFRVVSMDRSYCTYIVASCTGTLYIGMCNNIERRMWEHKSREFDGFASKYHCDRLVYSRVSTMFAMRSTGKSN
jgi:GIY-YIG catalytic domain-containing protein